MWQGIRAVKPGAHLGDIGNTIQMHAEGHGFSIVREFCGHGIGTQFHEEPQVLHYGVGHGAQIDARHDLHDRADGQRRPPGIRCLADGWTIVTADHSLSAQWEHTVLVTPDGYEVTDRFARDAAATGGALSAAARIAIQ
jgi:methionyl aminopeptidase